MFPDILISVAFLKVISVQRWIIFESFTQLNIAFYLIRSSWLRAQPVGCFRIIRGHFRILSLEYRRGDTIDSVTERLETGIKQISLGVASANITRIKKASNLVIPSTRSPSAKVSLLIIFLLRTKNSPAILSVREKRALAVNS